MLVFRAHEEVPSTITYPALRQLAAEWVNLNETISTSVIARFGIEGCYRAGDIVDRYDSVDFAGQDEILHALLFSQPGSTIGRRIVLQALLPRIFNQAWKLTHRGINLGTSPSSVFEERLHYLIADVWTVLGDYLPTSRSSIAQTIIHRAKARFFEELPNEVSVDAQDIVDSDGERLWLPEETSDFAEELDAVFREGLAQGVVAEEEVALLRRVYLVDDVTSGISQAADEHQVSRACIRKRCERARKRLATIAR